MNAGINAICMTTSNPSVSKIRRAMRLRQRSPQFTQAVDEAQNARDLSEAAKEAGIVADVVIDVATVTKRSGVPPGEEALALAHALSRGLHESSLDGFYHVARALCVHREGDLDAFDQAFSSHFRGIETVSLDIVKELEQWLADPVARRMLSDEERAMLESLDMVERFTPPGERRVRHRAHEDPLPRLLAGTITRVGKVSSIIRDARTQLDSSRRATAKRLKAIEEAFNRFMDSLREILDHEHANG